MESNKEYSKLVEIKSENSPIVKNIVLAFIVGGIICTTGQFFFNLYTYLGISEEFSRSISSASLILLSIILTGLHLYDKIAKFAGAGTLVPITGFANAVASPAIEFKSEGFVTGLGAKMFIIAGPVLVYGISSSVLYGLIVLIFHLY